jgi:cell division septum initiation protein DivIVA
VDDKSPNVITVLLTTDYDKLVKEAKDLEEKVEKLEKENGELREKMEKIKAAM